MILAVLVVLVAFVQAAPKPGLLGELIADVVVGDEARHHGGFGGYPGYGYGGYGHGGYGHGYPGGYGGHGHGYPVYGGHGHGYPGYGGYGHGYPAYGYGGYG